MAFRASLSVLLGCQFGQANKLLSAAERGDSIQVKQVLVSKPQLAAFTGFHGTTSPLHRAAAAGHLSTCKAIIELIKAKILQVEEAVNNGTQRSSTLKRWKSLLTVVLDQRSHRGQTPMMLACEGGHADITAFLLAEGADALAVDMVHCSTALHYAAAGGHSQCIKILCSDSAYVNVDGHQRLLRDVVTDDLQVHSAKFIDQRSNGGLTALHFAAVSGNLDSLQALLRAGAAIMVKTNAEALIGQEYLTSGSTPLHIAVLVGSIPLAHALLQAHAEMMTVISLGRDERHRRPWEGHSRSDIRSVRNSARKLPYHMARDKGWTQMMHLIDPRISVDAALDAARDTDHGIGPKNLATICSLVLQKSLLQWLDETETEIEAEKTCSSDSEQVNAGSRVAEEEEPAAASATEASSPFAAAATAEEEHNNSVAVHGDNTADSVSPTATTTASELATRVTASAPAIPALSMQSMGSLHAYLGMLCTRRPSSFDGGSPFSPFHKQQQHQHQQEDDVNNNQHNNDNTSAASLSTRLHHHHQRSATLGYGDLSRLASPRPRQVQQEEEAVIQATADVTGGISGGAGGGRTSSFTLRSRVMPRASSTGTLSCALAPLQLPFPTSSLPADGAVVVNVRSSGGRPSTATAAGAGNENQEHQQERPAITATGGGTMRRVLSSLREKLKSSEGSASGTDGDSTQDLTIYGAETHTITTETTLVLDSAGAVASSVHSSNQGGKGCYERTDSTLDSSGGCNTGTTTLYSSSSSSSAVSDVYDGTTFGQSICDAECGVCLDSGVQVAFSGCEHALCLQCARNLTKQEKKPPSCPFCRRMVVGFVKVQQH